jgi:DHA2 family multidrug resistance protein
MLQIDRHKWMVCLTVLLGAIMSAVDTSIVNVALPFMRGNLGASIEEITWVASGYILSSVIVMPVIAFLSARFGRRPFYLFSVFLFTASSLLCGLAWDLPSLIIFRVIQGLGGGVLLPISQAILRETFSEKEQGLAMGIYGMAVVIGPAFGPALGGWLTDNFSWPWIFYINVPLGIINFWMATKYIQEPSFLVRQTGKVDWLGLLFMTTSFVAMQIVFEKGQDKGWFDSDLIVYSTVIAVVSMGLFIWRELSVKYPVVDLSLFKDRNFICGTLVGAVFGLCLYSTLFLQPLFLQQLGYTATQTGMILIPRSLIMAIAMPLAGRLYNSWGPRNILLVGLGITVCSYWQFAHLSLDVNGHDLLVPQLFQGMGFGMMFVALSTVVLSTVDRPKMTSAVGLYNVTRQIMGSVGIAIAASLLSNGQTLYRSVLIAHVTAYNPASRHWIADTAQGFIHHGMNKLSAQGAALSAMSNEIDRQAQMLSFNHIFILMAFIFVLSIPLMMTIKNQKAKEVSMGGAD